jgi:hypothetical protein
MSPGLFSFLPRITSVAAFTASPKGTMTGKSWIFTRSMPDQGRTQTKKALLTDKQRLLVFIHKLAD